METATINLKRFITKEEKKCSGSWLKGAGSKKKYFLKILFIYESERAQRERDKQPPC